MPLFTPTPRWDCQMEIMGTLTWRTIAAENAVRAAVIAENKANFWRKYGWRFTGKVQPREARHEA